MTIVLFLLIVSCCVVLFFGCRWEWQREQEWKWNRARLIYEEQTGERLDTWHRLPAIRKEGDHARPA